MSPDQREHYISGLVDAAPRLDDAQRAVLSALMKPIDEAEPASPATVTATATGGPHNHAPTTG